MAIVLLGSSGSRAQSDLIAFQFHVVGSNLLVRVEAVLAAVEPERPVMPGAAYHRSVLADVAVAQRSALVDAAIGDGEDLVLGAEYRDRAGPGAERATLAFGEILDLAKQVFCHWLQRLECRAAINSHWSHWPR